MRAVRELALSSRGPRNATAGRSQRDSHRHHDPAPIRPRLARTPSDGEELTMSTFSPSHAARHDELRGGMDAIICRTIDWAAVEPSELPRRRAASLVAEQGAHMVIVAGHLTVLPSQREPYLAGCSDVVEQAPRAQAASTSPSRRTCSTRAGSTSSSVGSPKRRSRPSGDCPPNGVSGLARRRVSAGRLDSDDRDSQGRELDAQGSEEEDVVVDGVGP